MEKSDSIPHVYKTPFRAMLFFVIFGSVLGIIGLFLFAAPAWSYFAGITPKNPVLAFALTTVLGCMGGGMGVLMVIATTTSHVDLYPDAIVVGSALPFGNRRLERKDIGAKMPMFIYVPTYVLYPRSRSQKVMNVGYIGTMDKYFHEWMDTIPNVDDEFLKNRRMKKI